MKYIYVLGLIVIILCCVLLNNKENFTIPAAFYSKYGDPEEDLMETVDPPPDDTSNAKTVAILGQSDLPEQGIPLTKSVAYEKKPQVFEIEDQKCSEVKFCEDLNDNMNCGYCLQDDLEGLHPFHYGDEKGPFLKRGGNKQSLCKRGVKRDGSKEWTGPGYLNGKQKNELEKQIAHVKKTYPAENDERRISMLADLNDKLQNMGIQDTGYSGCAKMRERYICSKVNNCSPMSFTMFGIKASDICGFCADDGKAYVRQDLPAGAKSYTKSYYQSNPKCENIDIFGDGVNCAAYHGDKNRCISQKSISDPSITACAYNYHNERKTQVIPIQKPSKVKYGKTPETKIFDKCNSEWGLIRPSQCDAFEQMYPCLKSKMGGPHSQKCLQSLWNQLGFQTNYTILYNHGESALIESWKSKNVDGVLASMESLYEKVFSRDYEVAKKWAKICYGLDVNICNRSGFITSKYPQQYWKETSNPCMSLLYKFGGGKTGGLGNPDNRANMSYNIYGSPKNANERDTHSGFAWHWHNPNTLRENETETEKYGSSLNSVWEHARIGKSYSQRHYVNRVKELSKLKNMPNHDAERVENINRINWRNYKFSNVKWVDKHNASKFITGETPSYPTDKNKPCWPDFARRMLLHPSVKLINLKSLSFKDAREFHLLSWSGWSGKYEENLRRQGHKFFEGGNEKIVTKYVYEQDTFPFWKWGEVSKNYWRTRWSTFTKKLLDYEGVELISYKDFARPTNANVAEQIARAYGYTIGGRGYSFAHRTSVNGLYIYTHGQYRGRAYFGTGGSDSQKQTNLGYPRMRVDYNQNLNKGVLVFKSNSRFYEVLSATSNLRKTWVEPKFFQYRDANGSNVRVLFEIAYAQNDFPFHKFLTLTSKH